jgi:ATP-dependent RNA helicase DeaD
MRLPTHQDIAERRVEQFKELVMTTLEEEELSFYRQLVQEIGREHKLSPTDLAAALTFLAQKDRPLIPEEKSDPPEIRHERREWRDDRGGVETGPKKRSARDRGFDDGGILYRIEVGRNDGVAPKDIVGAIANEAGIPGKSIGHIKLYDDFSTVSLPGDMPKESLRRLEKTWILGKQIRIRLWNEDGSVRPGDEKPVKRKAYPKKSG